MARRPADAGSATATDGPGGRPLRLGIFGGTFDPPHVGHLTVARDVMDALALDRVYFVPARLPPHKTDVPVSSPEVRLEMIRAAVAAEPGFDVSDVEMRRPGPSYTVDTLRHFRKEHPGADLFLILGADQFAALDSAWKDPEEVVRLARIAVMDREGVDGASVTPDVPGVKDAMVRVPVTRVDVSSTGIRRKVSAGEPIDDLVPPGVARIVERRGLYG